MFSCSIKLYSLLSSEDISIAAELYESALIIKAYYYL